MKIARLVRLWLVVTVVSPAVWGTACFADVLQTAAGHRHFGFVKSETDSTVEFQVRERDGAVSTKTFARAEIALVIRTIDPEKSENRDRMADLQLFSYCEQLASYTQDHEAYWQLQDLLRYLKTRQLAAPLLSGVQRLQLQTLRPGKQRTEKQAVAWLIGELDDEALDDWQQRIVRQQNDPGKQLLLSVLQKRRAGQAWEKEWKSYLTNEEDSQGEATRYLKRLLSEADVLEPSLLRLEVLLESGQTLGVAPWPALEMSDDQAPAK